MWFTLHGDLYNSVTMSTYMAVGYIYIRNANVKYLNIDAVPLRDLNDPYIISVAPVRLRVIRRGEPTTLSLKVLAIGW